MNSSLMMTDSPFNLVCQATGGETGRRGRAKAPREPPEGIAELPRRALGGRCGRQGSSIVILGEPDANYAAPRPLSRCRMEAVEGG